MGFALPVIHRQTAPGTSRGSHGCARVSHGLLVAATTLFALMVFPHCVQSQSSDYSSSGMDLATPDSRTSGECFFDVPEDAISALDKAFNGDNTTFLYLHLKFPKPFPTGQNAYLEEGSNIIDPLTWVIATKGKGNFLLALPFDFTQLSMGALLPGVDHLDLELGLTDSTCFQDRNESDALQEMVEALFDTVSMALIPGETEITYSICIERQLREDELDKTISFLLPGSSYILFQTSTVYDCWDPTEDGASLRGRPVTMEKYRSLIYSVYILGVILALYSPLAGIFFIRISPSPPRVAQNRQTSVQSTGSGPGPIPTESFKTLAVHADLAYGFKYNLMFSGRDNRWIRLFRWLAVVLVFGIIPYVPYISWSAIGQLGPRMAALDAAGVLSYAAVYGLHILIEFCYYITIASILTFTFDDYDLVTQRLKVTEVDRVYFGLVELPEDLQIPASIETDNSIPERRAYGFFEAMFYRTTGLFNFGLYTYFFGSPFVWLQSKIQGPTIGPVVATVLAIILYIFALPVILMYFILNMLFYVFPLGDLIFFCLRKFIGNKIDMRDILVAVGIALLAVAIFFKFIAVFVYIGELIGFTFVGFLLNTETVGEIVLAGVLFIGFILNAVTGYYDGYCKLLLRIVQLADERDERLETEQRLAIAARLGKEDQAGQTQLPANVEFKPILFYNDQGVPFIKKDLWERIVSKYRPVRIEVLNVFVQLCSLVVVIVLGVSIIKTIDGFEDLPASVEFFGTVIVAGVIPALVLVLRSPGKMECLEESKWRQLEADLEYYADNNKFMSDILQY